MRHFLAVVLIKTAFGSNSTFSGHFLEYISHSGFCNQQIAYTHALFLAYALNRTLLSPPLLPHFALAYGHCDGRHNLDSIRTKFKKLMKIHKKGATMSRVLNSESVGDLVSIIDYSKWHSTHLPGTYSKLLMPWDCYNNIWVESAVISQAKCSFNKSRTAKECRVLKELGVQVANITLLSWGSTYSGFEPGAFGIDKITENRLRYSALEYTSTLRIAAEAISKHLQSYFAVHIRGGDHHFEAEVDETIESILRLAVDHINQELEFHEICSNLTMYVATDIDERRKINISNRAKQIFACPVHVAFLDTLLPNGAQKFVSMVPALDAFSMSKIEDLELHLDMLICASAPLFFIGTARSTVSASISQLRAARLSVQDNPEEILRSYHNLSLLDELWAMRLIIDRDEDSWKRGKTSLGIIISSPSLYLPLCSCFCLCLCCLAFITSSHRKLRNR